MVKVAKSFHQNFFTPNQHTAIDKQLSCMFKKNKLFSFPIDARRIFAILNLWFAYNKLNRAYIVQQWLEASNILLRWHLISIVPTQVCQDILSVTRLFIPSQMKGTSHHLCLYLWIPNLFCYVSRMCYMYARWLCKLLLCFLIMILCSISIFQLMLRLCTEEV